MAIKKIMEGSSVGLILTVVTLAGLSSLFTQSKGNFLPGPTCTVTSMIPGSPQTTSMEGNCASILTCRGVGGVPIGKCGLTNVCCVYPRSCDSRSSQNQTYFTNPGYPGPFNGTISCAIAIYRVMSPLRICQLRLDFVDFDINRPTLGDCVNDRFVVSGQNANSVIPALCGRNTGQHMYVDVDGAQGPFTLRVLTSGPGYRRWNIRVSQIECANPSRAPANCLQYYMGPSGTFSTFNYESSRPLSETVVTPQNAGQNFLQDASYFNNLDYSVCFRKEVGFCTQTYNVNTTFVPMEISTASLQGGNSFDSRFYGGAGAQRCPSDYVVLDGIRYCGGRLNPIGLYQNADIDAPVIDRGSGPFYARFVSNERLVGRGFQFGYQQNPCGSRLPSIDIQQVG